MKKAQTPKAGDANAAANLQTTLCRLLWCRFPILQAGMGGVDPWDIARWRRAQRGRVRSGRLCLGPAAGRQVAAGTWP